MPDPGSPHTHPEDYGKMGLDFERDNAAIQRDRGPVSPELSKIVSRHIQMDGVIAEAFGGSALLSGVVADRFQKERAEALAREVEGVTDVENHIHIQQSEAGGPVLTTRKPGDADQPSSRRS
jgi:osmotically-inducible protein OsmY